MRPRTRQHARSEDGFTLIELLISAALLLFVLTAAGTVLVMASRNAPRIAERTSDIQAGMVLQERVGREVRQGYRIEGATASSMVLYTFRRVATCGTNTPLAASQPAIACKVTYSCSASGTCIRSETNPEGTLTPKVQTVATGLQSNSVFTYTPSAAAPEYITMRLAFAGENGDDNVTLEDGFELRNR
jgi:prepilin-type N-terminal cleavage/methylation domain-containing protein